MDGSGGLPAALRIAAANLASAAANVGRVLESVAEALEPDDEAPETSGSDTFGRTPASSKPRAQRTPKKTAASPRVKKTAPSSAPSGAKATRGRRPSA